MTTTIESAANPLNLIDDDTMSAFMSASDKARNVMIDGLKTDIGTHLVAGDMEKANAIAELLRVLVDPTMVTDVESATRFVTFQKVTHAMFADLSDRARDLVDRNMAPVSIHLETRLAGVQVNRTHADSSGKARVASGEKAGSTADAMIGFFEAHLDSTPYRINDVATWIMHNGTGYGYTEAYVGNASQLNGRILAKMKSEKWLKANGIVFERLNMGGPDVQWTVRITRPIADES